MVDEIEQKVFVIQGHKSSILMAPKLATTALNNQDRLSNPNHALPTKLTGILEPAKFFSSGALLNFLLHLHIFVLFMGAYADLPYCVHFAIRYQDLGGYFWACLNFLLFAPAHP